jgi:hypothetical protein
MSGNESEPGESVSESSSHRIVDSLALIAVLLGVTGVMMITGLWQTRLMELQGVDAAGHWAWLRSTLLDGDLEFGNDYQGIMEPHLWPAHSEPIAETGHHANPFPIGCALGLLPLFLVTHLLLLTTSLGAHFPADGFSLPYGVAAFWSMWLWAAVGLLLTHAWMRRHWPRGVAFSATLLVWFATGAIHYTFPIVLNNHSLALLTMPLLLLTWSRWEERPSAGRAIVAGLACGLLFLTRWQLALWPVVLWLGTALSRGERPRTLWVLPLPALALALPQLAAWGVIYGQWLTLPQGESYIQWHRPMVHLLLFSTWRGWITWTPIAAVGLVGLGLGLRHNRRLSTLLLIGLALQLYVSSIVTDWHGAWGYAARRLTHATPVLAWGVAMTLTQVSAGKRARLHLATWSLRLLVLWNALFLIQQWNHLIPYHRPLTWHELIGDKFHLAASLERRFAVRSVVAAIDHIGEARAAGDEEGMREGFAQGAHWLTRARDADPNHEDVYLAAAMLAIEASDLNGAMREYQTCLDRLDVDRPQILTSMGVCLLYMGHPREAAQHAAMALEIRPGYADAQRLLEDAIDGRRDERHRLFFF